MFCLGGGEEGAGLGEGQADSRDKLIGCLKDSMGGARVEGVGAAEVVALTCLLLLRKTRMSPLWLSPDHLRWTEASLQSVPFEFLKQGNVLNQIKSGRELDNDKINYTFLTRDSGRG